MRKLWSKITLLGFFACSVCCGQSTVAAQPPDDYWSKIRAADAGPDASEVTWKCINTHQPQPNLNIEQNLAQSDKEWRQQGKTEAKIKQLSDLARQALLQSQQGHQQIVLMALVHQGVTTRAAVTDSLPYPIGAPEPALSLKPGYINFYDGKNSVVLSRAEPQAGVLDGKVWYYGSVKRDGNDIMPNVGLGELRFLAGTPVFADFTPANSSLQEGTDDTVLIEQRVQQHWGEQLVPLLTRWVISKQTWRPLLMEQRFDFAATKDHPANRNAHTRYRFLNYHQYPGALWWPSEIIEEQLSGRSLDEKPSTIYDYHLETAKFNGDADLTLLKKPLPVGAQISDQRFGPGPRVGYVSKGNILTDVEVRKLLVDQNGPPQSGEQAMSSYR